MTSSIADENLKCRMVQTIWWDVGSDAQPITLKAYLYGRLFVWKNDYHLLNTNIYILLVNYYKIIII